MAQLMKTILIILFTLSVSACGKKGLVCSSSYPSPYEVQFPDTQIRKASIAPCDGYTYKAESLDQHRDSFLNSNIVIRLRDEAGNFYLTTFKGQ
jgi:hypothetical protein